MVRSKSRLEKIISKEDLGKFLAKWYFLGFAKRFGCHPVTTPLTALTRRNILLTYKKVIFKFISKLVIHM
jgi:hypothetical protein